MSKIKFGTDGWRDKISKDFTTQNVKRATEGVARHLIKSDIDEKKGIAIGYDTRKHSDEFAEIAAKTFTIYDIPVYLNDSYLPTPALSHVIKEKDLAGAVMITASHNPPEYNGFKFFPHYGGPAYDYITREIEELIPDKPSTYKEKADLLKITSFENLYKDHLRDKNNASSKHQDQAPPKKLKIVVDSMHGAGCGYLALLLEERGHEVHTVAEEPSPDFCGKLPEPMDDNLEYLKQAVIDQKADLGLALDGDADRFGVVSSTGDYISPNQIFGSVADYTTDKWIDRAKHDYEHGQENEAKISNLSLSRTIATTHAIDKVAGEKGLSIVETPVGFKYLTHAMLTQNAIMGAEESGGLGVDPKYPEKDGIAAALFITEILEEKETDLEGLLKKTEEKYGTFISKRIDLSLTRDQKEKILTLLEELKPNNLAYRGVEKINRQKGLKLYLSDGSWCLMRPSGTEDLVRIYGESDSEKNLQEILDSARELLGI
ncbi:hypothetical protein [Natranaerofaba carboxydovora]|uniref:hypothetical protein n=1 Tax=Natranaerofaba carboxydovora TaxID=2742683 RepID=UPI001F137C94|nr:hypothetical protein [Natranaerofaba carboxydovora]UMZ74739.1 Phosphoglucomutase [Natranaerofaba carboxydovora]